MKKLLTTVLCLAVLIMFTAPMKAHAEYPYDKPINVIVPFGPGGAVDIATRVLAEYFQQNYKITLNVINKPGGGQALGLNEMLRARPDGYTMAFPGAGGPSITTKLSQVGFTHKDLKAIAQISVMELVLSVPKESSISSLDDMVQTAKTDPDKVVYASAGAITTQRLYMTKALQRFYPEVKLRHTAYASGHEVSTALLGKHITAGFQVPTNILPYVQSGDLKAIAISRHTRREDLPDTPTFRELFAAKLTPADENWIDLGSWHGLVFSSKVPDERVQTFLPLLEKALKDPDVMAKFQKIGLSIDFLGPKEFQKVINESSDLTDEVLAGRTTLD